MGEGLSAELLIRPRLEANKPCQDNVRQPHEWRNRGSSDQMELRVRLMVPFIPLMQLLLHTACLHLRSDSLPCPPWTPDVAHGSQKVGVREPGRGQAREAAVFLGHLLLLSDTTGCPNGSQPHPVMCSHTCSLEKGGFGLLRLFYLTHHDPELKHNSAACWE